MNEQFQPNPDTAEQKKQQKKSHRTLLMLIFLFGIPYATALYMYYGDGVLSSMKTSNNGQLVSPVRTMQQTSLHDVVNNQPISLDFTASWTMLTFADSDCDVTCTDNLYAMKQVRRALGVDRKDIQRIMLLLDQQKTEQLIPRLGDFSGMNVLAAPSDEINKLQQILQLDGQAIKNAIFLIDPQANYMMYYPSSTHPKLILEDMQLLIKVSKH